MCPDRNPVARCGLDLSPGRTLVSPCATVIIRAVVDAVGTARSLPDRSWTSTEQGPRGSAVRRPINPVAIARDVDRLCNRWTTRMRGIIEGDPWVPGIGAAVHATVGYGSGGEGCPARPAIRRIPYPGV